MMLDRFRKGTKVSIICDINKVPLACKLYKGSYIATFNVFKSCDVGVLEDNLPVGILPDRRNCHILLGDKGYISEPIKIAMWNTMRTNIITPYKKNQKKKNTKKAIKHLKQRYIVEHVFNTFSYDKI